VGSGADPETAEIINGLIRHIEQSSDAEVAYDTGMDFAVSVQLRLLPRQHPLRDDDSFDQDLILERISNPLAVYPDPLLHRRGLVGLERVLRSSTPCPRTPGKSAGPARTAWASTVRPRRVRSPTRR
jgi:hypothetical protein